jgi:hypothetical protein
MNSFKYLPPNFALWCPFTQVKSAAAGRVPCGAESSGVNDIQLAIVHKGIANDSAIAERPGCQRVVNLPFVNWPAQGIAADLRSQRLGEVSGLINAVGTIRFVLVPAVRSSNPSKLAIKKSCFS